MEECGVALCEKVLVKLDLVILSFVFVFNQKSLGPVPPVFPVKKQDEKVTLQLVPNGESIEIAP
jgi:hypothetical protein